MNYYHTRELTGDGGIDGNGSVLPSMSCENGVWQQHEGRQVDWLVEQGQLLGWEVDIRTGIPAVESGRVRCESVQSAMVM